MVCAPLNELRPPRGGLINKAGGVPRLRPALPTRTDFIHETVQRVALGPPAARLQKRTFLFLLFCQFKPTITIPGYEESVKFYEFEESCTLVTVRARFLNCYNFEINLPSCHSLDDTDI